MCFKRARLRVAVLSFRMAPLDFILAGFAGPVLPPTPMCSTTERLARLRRFDRLLLVLFVMPASASRPSTENGPRAMKDSSATLTRRFD